MKWHRFFWVAAITLLAAPIASADEALDWRAWQAMPLFCEGRIMPLDSFARQTVEAVCGQASPQLTLRDGSVRTFPAAELLWSWLVEPEAWNDVAFLGAEHEQLRQLLDQPIFGPDGRRLKFVTLAQVEQASKFRLRLAEIEQRQNEAHKQNREFDLLGLDRKVVDLERAYVTYRQITFRPSDRLPANSRAVSALVSLVEQWQAVEPDLRQFQAAQSPPNIQQPLTRIAEQMKRLTEEAMASSARAEQIERHLVSLQNDSAALAQTFRDMLRASFEDTGSAGFAPQTLQRTRSSLKQLVGAIAEVARLAGEAQKGLYDSGGSLRLVPALDSSALKSERKNEEAQPWLSLQTVLYGSDTLLAPYPQAQLAAVRKAYREAASVYVDRGNPQRPEKFASATSAFASAVRVLGQQIEPLRQKLVDDPQDQQVLALTAYPAPSVTQLELHYNQIDPFFWSWIVNLCALACLALAFGAVRRPLFYVGLGVLAAGQLLTAFGFGLRTAVTGWAPVTGMFESVVWVGFVVAMLGLWFTLQPLLWPGFSSVWRLTAVPGTWEASPLTEDQRRLWRPEIWTTGNILGAGLRLGLMIAVFYVLAVVPYGSDRSTAILSLRPRIDVGSSLPSFMDLITYIVGLGVLAAAMWYVPRLVITLAAAIVAVPYALLRQGIARPLRLALARQPYALVGAGMGFLIALIAYWSPLWHQDIEALRPVLRDRFWLYIHVLTITASYGAGALAYGLGNMALRYYLFGRYPEHAIDEEALAAMGHRPVHPREEKGEEKGSGTFCRNGPSGASHKRFLTPFPPCTTIRRPPEQCAILAGFIYRAMQVAVLLLAAGTILGGLWADVAWGRFWGWDAKEVWALISLLIYLVILHGRYAGWLGNFGLAAGSVIGATAIIGAYWGVNFWLKSGLHSYAQGDGGQIYVFSVLAVNWIFMAAAAGRYWAEMSAGPQK